MKIFSNLRTSLSWFCYKNKDKTELFFCQDRYVIDFIYKHFGSFRKEFQVTSMSIQTYTCLHNLECPEDISLFQTLKFKNKNIIETEILSFCS